MGVSQPMPEPISPLGWRSRWDLMNERAEAGDIAAAEALHADLQAFGSPLAGRTALHNTLLKAYAKAGDPRRATAHFAAMRALRVRANQKSFGKLVEAAARDGNADLALFWLDSMDQEFAVSAAAAGAALDACARAGRIDEAEGLFRRMALLRLQPDSAAYSCVAKAHAKAGRVAEAAEWLARLESSHSELGAGPEVLHERDPRVCQGKQARGGLRVAPACGGCFRHARRRLLQQCPQRLRPGPSA